MWIFSPENLGAFAFGLLIGWYVYYVNRYRKGEVQFSDVTTLVGAIGGAAVLKLFDTTEAPSAALFGWYGMGLAIGFFGYFGFLLGFVYRSENFDSDWFLDGRRKNPAEGWSIPASIEGPVRPAMFTDARPGQAGSGFIGVNPAAQMPAPQPFLGPTMLPQVVLESAPAATAVLQACRAAWPATKDDCNRFAKAVASHFGIGLTGNADDIVAQMQGPYWTRLADGKAAAQAAREGHFVLGGMSSHALGSAHGHVVVVVDGSPEHGLYPLAYWGSLNPAIRDNGGLGKGINWSFSSSHRDQVIYAARRI